MAATHQDVTFYAQIEPDWERFIGGTLQLKGARLARATQKQPDPPRDGALVVKVVLRIPVDRLLPLAPPPVVIAETLAEVTMSAEEVAP